MTGLVVSFLVGVAVGVWLLALGLVAFDSWRFGRVSSSGARRQLRQVLFRSGRKRLDR